MIMRIIFIVVFFTINSFGQTLDFSEIKSNVNDEDSNFYYPLVIAKFNENSITMADVDFLHLYYGKKYFGKHNPKFDKEYLKCIQNSPGKKKTSACLKALINDPTNLELLSNVYNQSQSLKEKDLLKYKFASLWKIINFYGDGKSQETPYIVNSVGEIYTISSTLLDINLIKYQRSSYSVKGGTIDKFYTKSDSVFFKVIYNSENLNLK